MKDDVKQKLQGLLTAYGDRLAQAERRAAAIKEAQAAFPERFAAAKEKIIRPALTEFVEELNREGHDATIRELDEGHRDGAFASASIALRVVPKPFAKKATSAEASSSCIEIIFSANRSERKVVVSSNNTVLNSGGSRGKRGDYDVDAVTEEVVVEQVFNSLQEAFAERR